MNVTEAPRSGGDAVAVSRSPAGDGTGDAWGDDSGVCGETAKAGSATARRALGGRGGKEVAGLTGTAPGVAGTAVGTRRSSGEPGGVGGGGFTCGAGVPGDRGLLDLVRAVPAGAAVLEVIAGLTGRDEVGASREAASSADGLARAVAVVAAGGAACATTAPGPVTPCWSDTAPCGGGTV